MDANKNKPGMPQLPEGEAFLFVRINPKTGDYSCMHSSLLDALALHKIAAASLDQEVKNALAPVMQPAIAIPGLTLPTLDAMRKKQS